MSFEDMELPEEEMNDEGSMNDEQETALDAAPSGKRLQGLSAGSHQER